MNEDACMCILKRERDYRYILETERDLVIRGVTVRVFRQPENERERERERERDAIKVLKKRRTRKRFLDLDFRTFRIAIFFSLKSS